MKDIAIAKVTLRSAWQSEDDIYLEDARYIATDLAGPKEKT